jgi:hypothetical protein
MGSFRRLHEDEFCNLCSSPNIVSIVAYLLKTGTVVPEKQPLLCNDRVIIKYTRVVSKKRLGKHVPTATDTHATIEVRLETVFSTRSVQRSYKEGNWANRVSSLRECVRKRGSWKLDAVRRGLERVKLKNFHC